MLRLEQIRIGNIFSEDMIIDNNHVKVLDMETFKTMIQWEYWKLWYPVPLDDFWYERFDLVGTEWPQKKIKYVHLLQNIYYWRTGKELKIKPPKKYWENR